MFKKQSEKLVGLSLHDYISAKISAEIDFDFFLIGDSLAMVCLGMENTLEVTELDMIRHGKAILKGIGGAQKIIMDVPVCSTVSKKKLLNFCLQVEKELGITHFKIEEKNSEAGLIKSVLESGYKVMAHCGLKPQLAENMKVVGRGDEADLIIEDIKKYEEMGVFSILLECVPAALSKKITSLTRLPVIGIGSGLETDGQILVFADLVGLSFGKKAKFVREYDSLQKNISSALRNFCKDVRDLSYPTKEESYK